MPMFCYADVNIKWSKLDYLHHLKSATRISYPSGSRRRVSPDLEVSFWKDTSPGNAGTSDDSQGEICGRNHFFL